MQRNALRVHPNLRPAQAPETSGVKPRSRALLEMMGGGGPAVQRARFGPKDQAAITPSARATLSWKSCTACSLKLLRASSTMKRPWL